MVGQHNQQGVGLIEILVTVVILAIGFLAAAQMQVSGMQFSQSAYHQSQANFMATDIIDRMRANSQGVQAGHYNGLTTSSAAVDPGCASVQCSPEDIARQDLYDWSSYLFSLGVSGAFVPLLPSADSIEAEGKVTRISDGYYSVTLVWAETINGQATAVPARIDFVTQYR